MAPNKMALLFELSSTRFSLEKLGSKKIVSQPNFDYFLNGHRSLSLLLHNTLNHHSQ